MKPEIQTYRDPVQDTFVWELRVPVFYIVEARLWRLRVTGWLLSFAWKLFFGKGDWSGHR